MDILFRSESYQLNCLKIYLMSSLAQGQQSQIFQSDSDSQPPDEMFLVFLDDYLMS